MLTKFWCDLDLWTPKCIGIFLSPYCIYVWNMKAVRWKLIKLSCQNQSVDKVLMWPWPLTPKCIGIFLSQSCIYIWNMKDVHWKLLKLPVLCRNQSVDKFSFNLDTFWPQNIYVSSSRHPACMYEIRKMYIENYSSYCVRTKVLTKYNSDLDLLTPICIGIFLSPSWIYVWNVKAVTMVTSKFGELWSPARQQLWHWSWSKVRVKVTTWCPLKEPVTRIMHAKYQYSIMNTSEDMSKVKDFVTDRQTDGQRDKTDGWMSFNVPAFAKNRPQKLLKLSCQNQSVDKVQLWPWPLDPKMYRYLSLAILHLCN